MPDRQPPLDSTATARLIAKAYQSFGFEESGIGVDEFLREPCRHLRKLSRGRRDPGSAEADHYEEST